MSMHWHVQWFDIIVVTFVGPYCKSTNNIIVVLPWNNEVAMNFSPYLHISIIIFNVFCNYLRDRQTYLQVTHDDFLNSRWQLARESIIVSNLNSPVAKKTWCLYVSSNGTWFLPLMVSSTMVSQQFHVGTPITTLIQTS